MRLTDKKILKIIENNACALATVTKDGRPNVIGVAYVKVVDADTLLVTDNYMQQTKDDIIYNPHVAMITWNSKWEGYKFIGKAQYHSSGKWLRLVRKMPGNKGLPVKGAVVVKIEKILMTK
jgi:predicted pyridoxine 5'-phosphate oxidase superfamily flavin-nucleotide-binding protein